MRRSTTSNPDGSSTLFEACNYKSTPLLQTSASAGPQLSGRPPLSRFSIFLSPPLTLRHVSKPHNYLMSPAFSLSSRISAVKSWPASKTHAYAWYSYAFAAEVFSACALAIFLPITLEQMAREVGYIALDLKSPCSTLEESTGEDVICKAKILGIWVDTASFR